MLDALIELDQAIFHAINGAGPIPFLDALAPYWREKTTWIPLYLVGVGWLGYRYRWRAVPYLLGIGLAVLIADQLSASVIKPAVERLRPCRDSSLLEPARVLVGCGGGYSFPSAHATNHFAVAVFIFLTWARQWGAWRYLLLVWAASIALGQVYVGVHYPLDITAGALLGAGIGWGVSKLYRLLPPRYLINQFITP
jgi:undecaprenyl-diphosphatase